MQFKSMQDRVETLRKTNICEKMISKNKDSIAPRLNTVAKGRSVMKVLEENAIKKVKKSSCDSVIFIPQVGCSFMGNWFVVMFYSSHKY